MPPITDRPYSILQSADGTNQAPTQIVRTVDRTTLNGGMPVWRGDRTGGVSGSEGDDRRVLGPGMPARSYVKEAQPGPIL
eukprot:244783-Hanusia_phi.AAC.1